MTAMAAVTVSPKTINVSVPERFMPAIFGEPAAIRDQFQRQERHVDGSIIRDHPTLEYDTTRTLEFKSIAVGCRRTRLRLQRTVWTMELYKFPHIGE